MNFSTTAGTLDQAVVTYRSSGVATTILRTSTQATVTASVGAQAGSSNSHNADTADERPTTPTTPATASGQASGSVTVNVSRRADAGRSPLRRRLRAPDCRQSFTFAVTAATRRTAARSASVTVDWGDGQTQNLGAVTGSTQCLPHLSIGRQSTRSSRTATDSFGNSVDVVELGGRQPETAADGDLDRSDHDADGRNRHAVHGSRRACADDRLR